MRAPILPPTGQAKADAHLRQAIALMRVACFIPEYREAASDAECLGLAIAHLFKWDGGPIFETAAEALEDANFHAQSEQVRRMWPEWLKERDLFIEQVRLQQKLL